MISTVFVLFLAVHALHSAAVPNGKDVEMLGQLIGTTLVYRHGDRTPASQYPGDPYGISYWPEGWGQLTTIGKQQHYALGQWSRARYQNLLSATFNVNDAYVRSSDVDRTLMSAESNLAGLYPPTGKQVWNKAIAWQPIPVHTLPGSIDYITGGALPPCAAYDKAYNAYLQSAEMKKYEQSLKPIYDYLSANLGVTVTDFVTVLMVRDSLFIQDTYNLTLPAWTRDIYPNNDKFYDAALKYYYASSGTSFLAKFRSGYLLKDIFDRFTAKAGRTLSPDYKYYAYSTHDSVLANLLNSLGVFDFKFVPYASAVIFELRYYQNEFYVQLYYKNTEKTPEPINIPQCGTACPLSKLYQVYAQILPTNDFFTACGV